MARKIAIRWKNDSPLSAIHAAHVVATGSVCNDRKTEQALVGPVTEINNRLLSASLDISTFWQCLLSETLGQTPIENACAIALTEAGCSELQIEQIASVILNRLSESRMAFQNRFPKLSEQLALRGRPLRDQWETYGPGLLASIAKQIWVDSPPDDWWPKRIDAILVQPMRGGDGGYEAETASIWMEAVLTDVDPTVPEVIRLAYVITMLAIDIHTRERSTEGIFALPWSVGAIPITLTAATDLDLIRTPELPIESAMRLWGVGPIGASQIVDQWWKDRQANPTPIPVALKKLSQKLESLRTPKTSPTGIDLTEFD